MMLEGAAGTEGWPLGRQERAGRYRGLASRTLETGCRQVLLLRYEMQEALSILRQGY